MAVPEIDVEELEARKDAGAVVFDVREPDEYEDAHVPGAIPVPLATVPDRLSDFPTEGTAYIICAAGGRSRRAAEFLRSNGIDAVNVAGGTKAWLAAGKPGVRGTDVG